MISGDRSLEKRIRPLRRVLILADESANWKVAGLRQLDRLALALEEFAQGGLNDRLSVRVWWSPKIPEQRRWMPNSARLMNLELAECAGVTPESADDLVLTTHLFLYRHSVAGLAASLPAPLRPEEGALWRDVASQIDAEMPAGPWPYLRSENEIGACERAFLRESGKSQDGLVSRYLNRPISRWITRRLLQVSVVPSVWSVLIFALPLAAAFLFLHGTYAGFVGGCAVFQLYSILDGCDGEIARAKFLQTEFGRRLDSLLDLVGNVLLALTLGVGLARQTTASTGDWFYISEGIAVALLIVTSEGIVFVRRSRAETNPAASGKWNGALYQRHHEFLERSGILFLGEKFAWWLVQLTKRDMAMLAFLILAIVGWPQGILHLLLAVSGISSALAVNAFVRQPAPAVAQEAS